MSDNFSGLSDAIDLISEVEKRHPPAEGMSHGISVVTRVFDAGGEDKVIHLRLNFEDDVTVSIYLEPKDFTKSKEETLGEFDALVKRCFEDSNLSVNGDENYQARDWVDSSDPNYQVN